MEADIIFNQHPHEQLLPGAEEEAEFGKLPTHEFLFSIHTYIYFSISLVDGN